MMSSFLQKLKGFWPIFLLFAFCFLLFIVNYKPGTFLSGWDNLHPEFNFGANIKRSIFSVWQEYQGLGLLGGMGHAADLVHQLFLFLLSFVFPPNMLRYLWVFITLFLGSVGAYKLIEFILLHLREMVISAGDASGGLPRRAVRSVPKERLARAPWEERAAGPAFLGALFYLLNLGTIQTFYAPFEAFIAHFAALPWLLLSSVLYFQKNEAKRLLFFVLVLLLSTPSAYIPTLFLVYLFALSLLLFVIFVLNQDKKTFLQKIAKLFLIIFFVNAFWLLPFLYFTLTNLQVATDAKINQMVTEEIFLRNKEFGNISDVALLKGFWFNNVDPNLEGKFSYMMGQWRDHLANPAILAIGYFLFSIVLIGFFSAIRTKTPLFLGFCALFLFSFTMLATNTPPFSWIDILFRKIPLFDQVFRFPFTKFSTLASLTYAIFFSMGIATIAQFLRPRNIIKYQFFIAKRQALLIFHFSFFILIFVFTLPAFSGHLFYEKERLVIPQEYFDLFGFFKKQNLYTRIANFPQHTFWGWNFYRWDYGGSGFLWYGIEQPILDRAFDVWSKTGENYYFELSHAIHSKDIILFENVLEKYQIEWLLVDKNVINPSSPKALLNPELEKLIQKAQTIEKVQTFGNIDVYKINLKKKLSNYVFIDQNLPIINSYQSNDRDQAFLEHGNYIVGRFNNGTDYPFRSLFSGKTQQEVEFRLEEKQNAIEFVQKIPKENNWLIQIPAISEVESTLPLEITAQKNPDGTLTINAIIKPPIVFAGNTKIFGEEQTMSLFEVLPTAAYPLSLNINGVINLTIAQNASSLGTTVLLLNQSNAFVLTDKNKQKLETQIILPPKFPAAAVKIPEQERRILKVRIPKVNDSHNGLTIVPDKLQKNVKNCDNFRNGLVSSLKINETGKELLQLFSKNATACTFYYASSLTHKEGYLILVEGKNLKGRSLHFWILDEDQKFSPIDTYLPNQNEFAAKLVLAPQNPFGKAYSFHFENISIGQEETINKIKAVSIYPIPYRFLTSLKLTNEESVSKNEVLIYSQSYDPGWKAYQIKNNESRIMNYAQLALPFLFGEELKEHVLVNNWENGWLIDNYTLDAKHYALVIIYLPQYLQYIGFGFLVATCLLVIRKLS